jgi:hypothetical protein
MLLVCNLGLLLGEKVSPWGSGGVLGNGVRRRKPTDSPREIMKSGDASGLAVERIKDGWGSYIAKTHIKVLTTVTSPDKVQLNHEP